MGDDFLVLHEPDKGLRQALNQKQNQVKMGLTRGIQTEVGSRFQAIDARACAKKAHRLLSRGKEEKAKEEVNSFKLELAASQPVLNAYVATSLEKQLMEVMSMEGFEFPDLLSEIRGDIDYGLFSVDATDELAAVLKTEVNPFDELGIDI